MLFIFFIVFSFSHKNPIFFPLLNSKNIKYIVHAYFFRNCLWRGGHMCCRKSSAFWTENVSDQALHHFSFVSFSKTLFTEKGKRYVSHFYLQCLAAGIQKISRLSVPSLNRETFRWIFQRVKWEAKLYRWKELMNKNVGGMKKQAKPWNYIKKISMILRGEMDEPVEKSLREKSWESY